MSRTGLRLAVSLVLAAALAHAASANAAVSGRCAAHWTALLDAVRLGPADDATAVTAAQLREVVERLITAGHWNEGDPDIWIVADSGYDLPRLAFVLDDLPVVVAGRVRSDRVFRFPAVRV